MATQLIEKARYSSGPIMIREYPEASGSLTNKKGEFVYVESDGQIVACASDATKILGIALRDFSGTENTMIPVLIAQDGTEFELNATGAVTALANRDAKFALYVASNIHYCDLSDTSNDALMVTEILEGAGRNIGDTNGRIKVVVIPAAQQLGAQGT